MEALPEVTVSPPESNVNTPSRPRVTRATPPRRPATPTHDTLQLLAQQQSTLIQILQQLTDGAHTVTQPKDDSATILLARQFEAQERRSREAWRSTSEALSAERSSISNQPIEQLRDEYLELAKAAQLSPEDAVTVAYLLYADEADRKFWAASILRKHGNDRVRAHNFSVGSKREEAFMSVHGAKLLNFTLPLYPALPSFSALNTRILSEVPHGGSPSSPASTLFRTNIEGAGFLPVGQLPDGQWAADSTSVENQLKRQVSALESKLRRVSNQGRGRGRGSSHYDPNNTPHGAYRANGYDQQRPPAQQGNEVDYPPGRSYGRSRGNGRGRGYPRGGESSDPSDARAPAQGNF